MGERWHLPMNFGNILLNALIVLVFNNKCLWNYKNDLIDLKYIKNIDTFSSFIFVFSTFVSPRAMNFTFSPKKILPPEKIPVDAHDYVSVCLSLCVCLSRPVCYSIILSLSILFSLWLARSRDTISILIKQWVRIIDIGDRCSHMQVAGIQLEKDKVSVFLSRRQRNRRRHVYAHPQISSERQKETTNKL